MVISDVEVRARAKAKEQAMKRLKRFERKCNHAKLKISDVVKEAGINRTTYWKWLYGDGCPKDNSLCALEVALEEMSKKPDAIDFHTGKITE